MQRWTFLALLLCLLTWSSAILADSPPPRDDLNAAAWMRSAPEPSMMAAQAFSLARLRLDEALEDADWTAAVEQAGEDVADLQRTAVILDVDETVLDNSAFNAALIAHDLRFSSDLWTAWTEDEAARPVAGALAFIRHARERGVKVFLVTNRKKTAERDEETPTIANLAKYGLAFDPEDVLLRGEKPSADAEPWTGDKTSRRRYVADQGYRILLLIGDDLNDFVPAKGMPAQERVERARAHDDYWGSRWIVLPNPVYGSWERSFHGGSVSARRSKHRAMEPWEPPADMLMSDAPSEPTPQTNASGEGSDAENGGELTAWREGAVIGHRRSKIYHVPDGAFYERMKDSSNAVFFTDAEAAEEAGYRRSKR